MHTAYTPSRCWSFAGSAVLVVLFLLARPGGSAAQVRIEVRPVESMTVTGEAFLRGEVGKPVLLAGALRLPRPGTDKLPAVVLAHPSGGINAGVDRWAQELNTIGIAAFLLDGFSGRGLTGLPPDPSNETFLTYLVDAYRALGMLAQHPRIDPARIAVMGFSMGGLVATYTSTTRFWKTYGPPTVQFAAHIGVYGNCGVTYHDDTTVTGKPIRLFHGGADDIELVAPCRAYVSRLKAAGADVTLTEYADAHHGYDWAMYKEAFKLPQARTGRNCALAEGERGQLVDTATGKPYDPAASCNEKGGTLLYHEAATAATTTAVKEFLSRTFALKP